MHARPPSAAPASSSPCARPRAPWPARATLLLGLGLAAPVSGCGGGPPRRPDPAPDAASALRGAPIRLPVGDAFAEIAALEDRRDAGKGRLVELARSDDAGVRERAVTALGRLPFPEHGAEISAALGEALEDAALPVRQAAAFALGMRGDPASISVLLAYRNDPEPTVRGAVVEAASRFDDPVVASIVPLSLNDADVRVRVEAALGTARWSTDGPGAEAVDRSLIDALSPHRIADAFRRGDGGGAEARPEFTWRLLYALGRRRARLGRGAFLEYANAPIDSPPKPGQIEQRLFAVIGLARIPADPEIVDALAGALRASCAPGGDWRVAVEAARGLGASGKARAADALGVACESDQPHVRAEALAALGSLEDAADATLPLLRQGMLDLSPSVRAAALEAMVRTVEPEDAVSLLRRNVTAETPILRAAAARAAGRLDHPGTPDVLLALARDPDPFVSTAAVEALGAKLAVPAVRPFLHARLADPDAGVRLAAVLALREAPDPADVEPLIEAFRTSTGDVSAEIAFNALENLALVGGPAAKAMLAEAAHDRRVHVRTVARRELLERFGESTPALAEPLELEGPTPVAGGDIPAWTSNPIVEVDTNRGRLVFELFPAEAPLHVFNFLELARQGRYDGLGFHRVVPDFVVQGGDHRGDGNGARPWRGEALRHEIGPRKYVRGSLGMPRNDDLDSGGSQFFVTHRPTPHLDGRYTIFGELRQGFEVLDRIEVGDRILGLRIQVPPRPPGSPGPATR